MNNVPTQPKRRLGGRVRLLIGCACAAATAVAGTTLATNGYLVGCRNEKVRHPCILILVADVVQSPARRLEPHAHPELLPARLHEFPAGRRGTLTSVVDGATIVATRLRAGSSLFHGIPSLRTLSRSPGVCS